MTTAGVLVGPGVSEGLHLSPQSSQRNEEAEESQAGEWRGWGSNPALAGAKPVLCHCSVMPFSGKRVL